MKSQLFSEVIKLKDGILYNLSYHQARINRTATSFYNKNIPIDFLSRMIPSEKMSGLYKCQLIYSDHIHSINILPYSFRLIKNMQIVHADTICYENKYADRRELEKLVTKSQADEIIIVKNGYVTDTSYSNLVFEDETGLYTPDTYLLRGTKRDALLETNIIKTKTIKETDVKNYKAIYLINAMIDIEDKIMIYRDQIKDNILY